MKKGFSTIELLIAFAILFLVLPPLMLLAFGGQSGVLDVTLSNGGVHRVATQIRDSAAQLTGNWNADPVDADENDAANIYNPTHKVTSVSPCLKQISASTTWTSSTRPQGAAATTYIPNIAEALALGGDCDPFPSSDLWKKPKLFSSHNFNPGKPVSMDVLTRMVYITDTKNNIQIYNTNGDALGSGGSYTITPYADAGGKQLNGIDVAKWTDPSTGAVKRYAYVVRNDAVGQFQVVDVTNPGTYTTSAVVTLTGTVPPTGSFPQGWRVFYFDKKAYVTTRETAGYEFHTIDVTTPTTPIEIGPGYEINGTVNDLVISNVMINDATYKVAVLATDKSVNEIMAFDITNSAAAPSLRTSIDMVGTTDALSLQLLGDRLYVGRQKTAGSAELLVYSVSYGVSGGNLSISFTPIGSGAELNHDATYLRVAGKFAFIGDPAPTTEFEVRDISNPAISIPRIDTTPLGLSNKTSAMDYDNPYIYVASLANDALQVLYSAP